RYDAEPVLDDEALKGRLRYILAHGVKEGLVKKCRQWPGFSSYPELVEGSKRSFAWPKLSLSNVANKKKRPKKQAINIEQDIEYPIRITLLPCYKDKPQEQQIMVRDLVAQIENEHMLQRKDKSFLGIAKVLSQHPHDKPHNIKRSVRPLCHASSVKAVETYKAEYEAFAIIYAEASKQYREQIKTKAIVSLQNFPQNSYPPPINWGKRAEQQTTV
ncbi:MAG: hypothetical protein JW841_16255, partial [Deltaproteobacteria bacterium]|nr:hypothetical protein [Deltaproteobacteria bacterium]